uniref:hypothetical protein n=1 Tax=Paractinoplanes polyasparticus TaxID=2856853 RepID=UPI001C85B5BF|nr:hypothetical protein [Actinoplanes polyasparticus]
MDALTALLRQLVGQRSVFLVAVRARLWPGTLQRYLTGESLPPTAAPLEAIGIACGANEWQLNALVEAWSQQKHPPIEVRHGGFVFRDDRRSGPGNPVEDMYHRVLHQVWVRTGQLTPVTGQDAVAARAALEVWQLDRLLADRKLRDGIRKALAPDVALPPDPDALERRVAAEITVGYERGRSPRALDLIGAGLLHPQEAMRTRALAILSSEPPPPLSGADRVAVLATVASGVATDLAEATAPADRDLVNDGIRACYRLAGLDEPETILWVDSPYVGVLLRRLAAPLYDIALWSRTDRQRDVGVIEFRYPDDLRERIDRELQNLLGTTPDRPTGPLAGLVHNLTLTGRPSLVATDPVRARQALEDAAARLPKPRPVLAAGDPPPAHRYDRYFHLDGQANASWISRATRLAEALRAAGTPIGDLPERVAAYRDANSAGPWWPSPRLVIVCERPTEIGPGPEIRWADGSALADRPTEA